MVFSPRKSATSWPSRPSLVATKSKSSMAMSRSTVSQRLLVKRITSKPFYFNFQALPNPCLTVWKKLTAKTVSKSSSSSSGDPLSMFTLSCAFGSLLTTPSFKSCLLPPLAVNIAASAVLSTGTCLMNGWARMVKPW